MRLRDKKVFRVTHVPALLIKILPTSAAVGFACPSEEPAVSLIERASSFVY